MQDDNLGDWRIQAVSRLLRDVPAHYPGGPSHPAGTPVFQSTVVRDPRGGSNGFTTPSATALALNIAMKASIQANAIRATLAFTDVVGPEGSGWSVSNDQVPALYDCFEQCLIAATFSFQAIEYYCNHIIARKLEGKPYPLKRKKGIDTVSSDEVERIATTEEKTGVILPDLLAIASPKGKQVWGRFVDLKRVRDASVHLKSVDQYPHRGPTYNIDDASVFAKFLFTDTKEYPKAAIATIRYFYPVGTPPSWLSEALQFLGS